jgi:hypothetical protein
VAAVLLTGLFTAVGVVVATASPAAADGEVATFHFKPGDNVTSTIESTNVPDAASNFITPADCTGTAPTCDVVRVYLERDPSPDATNFLRVELSWDNGPSAPAVVVAVAALSPTYANDIDMYIYDADGKRLKDSGGLSANQIEVAGITATTPYYDLVISQFTGATTQYTLKFSYSNELFTAPFELLDPAFNDGSTFTPPVDHSGTVPSSAPLQAASPAAGSFADPAPGIATSISLTPAVVAADTDFTGFRGAVDDKLGAPIFATPAAQTTARVKSPALPEVLFWLVMFPLALALGIFILGRRRQAAAVRS